MTYGARKLLGLAGGVAAAALAWTLSGSAWGRSGDYPVVRTALRTAGLPGTEEGVCRLFLNVPPSERQLGEISVPREIYDAVQEGDILACRIRALPLAGIEAIDFQARRSGVATVAWNEGYPFLYLGIAAAGVAAGLAVWGLASLAANLFRLSAPPDA